MPEPISTRTEGQFVPEVPSVPITDLSSGVAISIAENPCIENSLQLRALEPKARRYR
jgi:hypothetical protein